MCPPKMRYTEKAWGPQGGHLGSKKLPGSDCPGEILKGQSWRWLWGTGSHRDWWVDDFYFLPSMPRTQLNEMRFSERGLKACEEEPAGRGREVFSPK